MKKIIGALALSACFSVYAAEDSAQKLPENGVYVGIGLSTTSEKHDFNMDSVPNNGDDLRVTTSHSGNKRNHCGQFFIGYKIYSPIFLALEINLNLNKGEEKRSFAPCELPGTNRLHYTTDFSIKKGNDTSLLLKFGKTFCSHITPYAVVGLHKRKVKFDYVYLRPSDDLIAGGADDFSYANRHYEVDKMGFVYGVGVAFSLENNLSVSIEYNCRRLGDIKNTTLIGANPDPTQGDLDVLEEARHYLLKNKSNHVLSITFSKSFSLPDFLK